jgi:hypothetical protein
MTVGRKPGENGVYSAGIPSAAFELVSFVNLIVLVDIDLARIILKLIIT